MIKKIFIFLLLLQLLSCGNIEFVLKDSDSPNLIKNNVQVVVMSKEKNRLTRELYSYFGNNIIGDYVLVISMVETKENRVVKKNQVAEKIDYGLNINYDLFYKSRECKVLNKKIITKFTTSPKSFGYNFGADRSLDKLYISSINRNIQEFIQYITNNKDCLK